MDQCRPKNSFSHALIPLNWDPRCNKKKQDFMGQLTRRERFKQDRDRSLPGLHRHIHRRPPSGVRRTQLRRGLLQHMLFLLRRQRLLDRGGVHGREEVPGGGIENLSFLGLEPDCNWFRVLYLNRILKCIRPHRPLP